MLCTYDRWEAALKLAYKHWEQLPKRYGLLPLSLLYAPLYSDTHLGPAGAWKFLQTVIGLSPIVS